VYSLHAVSVLIYLSDSAGRCILLMYIQSELKDLNAPKKTNIGELKEKIQQLLRDNPRIPLSTLEEEIQSWMEIPFIHWEKSDGKSLIEYLKGLQLEWYNFIPTDHPPETTIGSKDIVNHFFAVMELLNPKISAPVPTLQSLSEASEWTKEFLNDHRLTEYIVTPSNPVQEMSMNEVLMVARKVAQKYKGMDRECLKYQLRNTLTSYFGLFSAEESDQLYDKVISVEYPPENTDDLLIVMDAHDHQIPSLLALEESIQSLPFMADLSSVVLPYASLKDIRAHLQAISNGSTEFKLVEISFNQFIKIPRHSSVSDYQQALAKRNPMIACAHLIALILSYGSLEDLPLGQLRESTVIAYQGIVSAISPREALSILIQTLCLLPLKLSYSYFDLVIRPMVLKGLFKYSDAIHLPWNQRIRLASIGQVFSVTEWQLFMKEDTEPIEILFKEPKSLPIVQKRIDPINLPPIQPPSLTSLSCQSIIQSIRSDEYGFDIKLSEKESRLFKAQYERNCRAMQRLAHELYSSDSHFVLELLQNADDNHYPSQVTKTLRFIIHHQGIVVCNNESGFTEKNIRALSDVGASTKNFGSIGRKGIGFKSVFRITDAPEVHSGGFHVRFDKKDAMVPSWIDTSVAESWLDFAELSKRWNTIFVLPFNASTLERDYVRDCFSEVQANVLLFL
jgi:hypothetical protein